MTTTEAEQLTPGTAVRYQRHPHLGGTDKGIVKSITEDRTAAFVVYHCAGDWENYQDYTGARTDIKDLLMGWI